MSNFQLVEGSEDNFTLTASRRRHVNSQSIILSQNTTVQAFTAALFNNGASTSGLTIWAVDTNNAQRLIDNNSFSGFILNKDNQYGLSNITLPAGTWWVGVTDDGLTGTQSVQGFDEMSVLSLPGSTFSGNIAMATGGNAGAWKAQGFTISGNPAEFIETEGSGGKYMIMNDAQYNAFSAKYPNGFTGGSYSFTYAMGGLNGGPALEMEGEMRLPAGKWNLVWINDSGGWAGGAANISIYSTPGGNPLTSGGVPFVAGGSTNATYRFYDTATGDHFYTTASTEALSIAQNIVSFVYEGAPWTTPHDVSGLVDVYRFFDTSTGNHFYTSSFLERNQIINANNSYHYEGISFQAYADANHAGALTLERFYNTITGQHHFSATLAETASILAGDAGAGWRDEGKGFIVAGPG